MTTPSFQTTRKLIAKRIADGDKKSVIFAEYAAQGDGTVAARILASIPTAANRKRYAVQQRIFVSLFSAFATISFISSLLADILAGVPLLFLLMRTMCAVTLYVILVSLLVKCNPVAYLSIGAISIFYLLTYVSKIVGAAQIAGITFVILPFLVILPLFALYMHLKLAPQATFLLLPKRNKLGEPLFED